uniref:MtaA/CmuA family methyltransferase n=1 Tax=Candidatus Methanomethylicus mesodigestus TaxID=1867258 RepID=A0A7C3J1N5_9CREN
MNEINRLLNAINLKEVDRKPVVSVTQTGTCELMKLSNSWWPDAHNDPLKMASLAMAAYFVGGFENVRIPFGLHNEAAALGCKVNYYEGSCDRTPVVEALENKNMLKNADPSSSITTRVIIDAAHRIKERAPDVPLVVGVLAPFSITGHIYGVAKLMKMLIKAPNEIYMTMDLASDFLIKYINEIEKVGADVITLVEPTATGENIGPVLFEKYALPYIEKIVKKCKLPCVLHICGNSTCILSLMVRSGVKGISIDHKVDIKTAKNIIAGKTSLIGNVNPVDILIKKPKDIADITLRVIEQGIDLVAPGCGLAPRTPTVNIQALTKTVKNHFNK